MRLKIIIPVLVLAGLLAVLNHAIAPPSPRYIRPETYIVAETDTTVYVRDDRGGRADWRRDLVNKIIDSGKGVVLMDKCASSCSLYLKVPNVCTFPDTRFMFHAPRGGKTRQVFSVHHPATQWYINELPVSLRAWYTKRLTDDPEGEWWVMGAELVRLGVLAECVWKTAAK